MLKTVVGVFLIIAVTSSTPARYVAESESYQTTDELYATFEASFTAELTAYATTHTQEEVAAYAKERLNQITSEAVISDGDPLSLVMSPEILYGSTFSEQTIFYDPDAGENGGYDPVRLRFCMDTRNEECRRAYNAEVLASAAVASGIMAGCIAVTVGSGLVLCAAAALAAHALGIAAASQRYNACTQRAYSDCVLQYGGFRK